MRFKAEVRGHFLFGDPEDGTLTELYVYRDPETGYLFAVEANWLELEKRSVLSPFVEESVLSLKEPSDEDLELGLSPTRKLVLPDDEEEEDAETESGFFSESDDEED